MLSTDTPGSVADLLRRGLEQNGVNSVIQGVIQGPESAETVRETSLQAAGLCYVGLPAELFWLCRHAPDLRPETVLLSADYVSDSITKVLAEEWGCRVFTHYGMTETCYGLAVQCSAGNFAASCTQGGHHLRPEDYIVEIIDDSGAELPPGQEGEIVITSLKSEAMPLLRYRTGDIGSLITEPCPCGSLLPRLGKIRGRREYLRNRLNIHMLDDLLFALPDIKGYRAALDKGILRLTFEGGAANEKDLSETLGIEVRVDYGTILPYGGKRELEIRG
jgi:hypothetical protein